MSSLKNSLHASRQLEDDMLLNILHYKRNGEPFHKKSSRRELSLDFVLIQTMEKKAL